MLYESEQGRITMALNGDLLPARHLTPFTEERFLALRDLLRSADVCFANLETLVCHYGEGFPAVRTGTHMLTEPELLEDLKWFGFNLVATANSMSLCFGEEGVLLNNRYLDAAGIVHAGTGRNLREAVSPGYLDTPGGRVALIATSSQIPMPSWRATNQRVDFPGKPGLNPLAYRVRLEIDRRGFDELRRLGATLGFDAERERTVAFGFAGPAAASAGGQDEYEYRGDTYVRSDHFAIHTQCDKTDLEENLRQVREARRQADWIIVSHHNQEYMGPRWLPDGRRGDVPEQPEHVAEFAHACIDAGADVFACHGPHYLMGVEIYKDRPVFYSLGNLIFENEALRFTPAYPYERFGLGPLATPADFFDARTGAGTRGHPVDPKYWETIVATCRFDGGKLQEIRLHPVELGLGRPRSQRGRPLLAAGEAAQKTIANMQRLCAPYGTKVGARDGVGVISVR